jgi:hypothetical protein
VDGPEFDGGSREGAAWAASRAIEAELDLDPEASSEEIGERALSITRPDVQEALLLGLLEQTVSPVSPAAMRILALVGRLHEQQLQVSIRDIAEVRGVSAETVAGWLHEVVDAGVPSVRRQVEGVVRDYQEGGA